MGPYFCILLYLTILVLYSPRGKGPCLINLLHSPDHMLHLQWIFNRPLWLNDPMLHFLLYMWCNVTWVQWYNQQVRLTLQGVKLELTIFASAGRAFVVVLSLSRVHLSATPWTAAHQASLSFTIFWNLLRFMFTESVMPFNHLVLCHPFLLLPPVFPSIRVFSNESALHIRWSKYWNFIFSISPSNEYSGLISFRIDWFDLLAIQRTLKSLLQHHSSKASILWCSDFFLIVQLSHPYMTTGKTIAFAIQTFVSEVISLLFNTLSRFVIAFLPRSKCLFISWLQSSSTVILEPKKIKPLLSFDFHFWVGTFWSQNYWKWVNLPPNPLSYSHIDLVLIFLSRHLNTGKRSSKCQKSYQSTCIHFE